MTEQTLRPDPAGLMEAVGLNEEPWGVHYTDHRPEEGVSPKAGILYSAEQEARGEVDWGQAFGDFSCVIGKIWLARKKRTLAWFDREHFGCLGGAFYLGFQKPQLEAIVHYVSTGLPGMMEGERYLSSPEATRRFFQTVDPRPAPARYCVFKPLSRFDSGEQPEVVIFFARPESMSGLHQLAAFVTDDMEVVASPFGAGCTNIVTWPLKYAAQGQTRAVLGGWDPSQRKFLKTDEITLAVPYDLYLQMAERWSESFLRTPVWKTSMKKVARSRRAWGEE
ncbi:MAG: DUF169 domain-containing protein [Proteobacteria bacterium]|nr:DUF169 domain-containing protein [Pseudomonadota bacterium]